MGLIDWHETELNHSVAGTKSKTAATANGPVKWGVSAVGTFVITCDSKPAGRRAPEGVGLCGLLAQARRRVVKEGISLNAAANECRTELKRLQQD
jgi:hypothetical protein